MKCVALPFMDRWILFLLDMSTRAGYSNNSMMVCVDEPMSWLEWWRKYVHPGIAHLSMCDDPEKPVHWIPAQLAIASPPGEVSPHHCLPSITSGRRLLSLACFLPVSWTSFSEEIATNKQDINHLQFWTFRYEIYRDIIAAMRIKNQNEGLSFILCSYWWSYRNGAETSVSERSNLWRQPKNWF